MKSKYGNYDNENIFQNTNRVTPFFGHRNCLLYAYTFKKFYSNVIENHESWNPPPACWWPWLAAGAPFRSPAGKGAWPLASLFPYKREERGARRDEAREREPLGATRRGACSLAATSRRFQVYIYSPGCLACLSAHRVVLWAVGADQARKSQI